MEYRDWEILIAVEEEKSLSRAAERLFIAQSTLSYRLANLEKEIGMPLLVRHAKGVSFTLAGERLVQYARKMQAEWKQVRSELRALRTPLSGTLRVGASSVVAKYRLGGLLKGWKAAYPEIHLQIEVGSSTLYLPKLFAERKLDAVICRGDGMEGEHRLYLEKEPWVLAVPPHMDLKDLPSLSWVQYESLIFTKEIKRQIYWWNRHFDRQPYRVMMVDSIDACLQMIACGLGWSLVPRIHIRGKGVKTLPVLDEKGRPVTRETVLYYHDSEEKGALLERFRHYVQSRYQHGG